MTDPYRWEVSSQESAYCLEVPNSRGPAQSPENPEIYLALGGHHRKGDPGGLWSLGTSSRYGLGCVLASPKGNPNCVKSAPGCQGQG